MERNLFYVLFGENKWNSKIDMAFRKFFPEIFDWMVNEKRRTNDHRIIAHELQKKESKLIFDIIIYKINSI